MIRRASWKVIGAGVRIEWEMWILEMIMTHKLFYVRRLSNQQQNAEYFRTFVCDGIRVWNISVRESYSKKPFELEVVVGSEIIIQSLRWEDQGWLIIATRV